MYNYWHKNWGKKPSFLFILSETGGEVEREKPRTRQELSKLLFEAMLTPDGQELMKKGDLAFDPRTKSLKAEMGYWGETDETNATTMKPAEVQAQKIFVDCGQKLIIERPTGNGRYQKIEITQAEPNEPWKTPDGVVATIRTGDRIKIGHGKDFQYENTKQVPRFISHETTPMLKDIPWKQSDRIVGNTNISERSRTQAERDLEKRVENRQAFLRIIDQKVNMGRGKRTTLYQVENSKPRLKDLFNTAGLTVTFSLENKWHTGTQNVHLGYNGDYYLDSEGDAPEIKVKIWKGDIIEETEGLDMNL